MAVQHDVKVAAHGDMTRRHRRVHDTKVCAGAAFLAVAFAAFVIYIAAVLLYRYTGDAAGSTAPAALLGFLGHSLPVPKTDLVYEKIPTDAQGVADAVLELSNTCFETPFEEQPQSLVKPQLYRWGNWGNCVGPMHACQIFAQPPGAPVWSGCLPWSPSRMGSWQAAARSSTCSSTAGCADCQS